MRSLAACALVLLLAACDSIVQRVPHPDRAYRQQSTQSCDLGPGYCYECGFGFNGKYECSMGMKMSCSGSEPTTVLITPVTAHTKRGKTLALRDITVVSVNGPCS